LTGYYGITYGRYRAIYTVNEHEQANGRVIVTVRVRFVAAGMRKASDKKDVYNLARRLLERGLLDEDAAASPSAAKKPARKKRRKRAR